jgi:hypothetical protein
LQGPRKAGVGQRLKGLPGFPQNRFAFSPKKVRFCCDLEEAGLFVFNAIRAILFAKMLRLDSKSDEAGKGVKGGVGTRRIRIGGGK